MCAGTPKRRCARPRFSLPELACSLVVSKVVSPGCSDAEARRPHGEESDVGSISKNPEPHRLRKVSPRTGFLSAPSLFQEGAVRGGRAIHTRLYRVEPM